MVETFLGINVEDILSVKHKALEEGFDFKELVEKFDELKKENDNLIGLLEQTLRCVYAVRNCCADFTPNQLDILIKQSENAIKAKKKTITGSVEQPIKNWDYFVVAVGASISSTCIHAPRQDNVYGDPSISFDSDGSVWASGNHGSVRIFKNCPASLMYQIYMQRSKEVMGVS